MPEDQQTGKVFNLPSRNMLEQIYRTKLDELKSRVRQRYEEESQLIDGFRAIPEAERVILTLPEAARFLDSDEAGIQSLMDRGAVHFVPITWGVAGFAFARNALAVFKNDGKNRQVKEPRMVGLVPDGKVPQVEEPQVEDVFVTIQNVAKVLELERKSVATSEWPPADVMNRGRRPKQWKKRKLLPTLKRLYPDTDWGDL
ncbi:MAG: hypothetical protein O3A00_16590 [Planctomycetota bacterium]|nr:hypothetical protein [Planctomycetota bacterium]